MSAPSRDEIVELIGEVDDSYIKRIQATDASVAEIAEAIDYLEGRIVGDPSPRGVETRRILAELFDAGESGGAVAERNGER